MSKLEPKQPGRVCNREHRFEDKNEFTSEELRDLLAQIGTPGYNSASDAVKKRARDAVFIKELQHYDSPGLPYEFARNIGDAVRRLRPYRFGYTILADGVYRPDIPGELHPDYYDGEYWEGIKLLDPDEPAILKMRDSITV